MENKSHALAAGIFVLVVAAMLAGLAVWLTRDNANYEQYELSTRDGVSGLQPQAAAQRSRDAGTDADPGAQDRRQHAQCQQPVGIAQHLVALLRGHA